MRNLILFAVLLAAVCAVPGAVATPVSPEVCLLPKEPGHCLAEISVFAYIKEKNRCEMFTYRGCGGNANNFATAEECYKTCGGDTPSANIHCENVECDLSLSQYYQDRGCRPQYEPGACCPIRYVCPRGEVASVPSCSYRGVHYAVGERIPQIREDIPCKAGCYCHGDGNRTEIVCANVECFHPNQFKQGCTRVYDHSSCCPTKYICPGDETAAEDLKGGCEHKNTTYYKGERMPSDDPCKSCICVEGPDGSAKAVCKDVHCIIELPAPDCVPVYSKDYCCPFDYMCPTPVKQVTESEKEAGTVPVTTSPAEVEETSVASRNSPVVQSVQEPETVHVPVRRPKSEVCSLPKLNDKCRGNFPRYYFDIESETCKKFRFGGCRYNGNNFLTEEECLQTCEMIVELGNLTSADSSFARTATLPAITAETPQPAALDVCSLPKEVGPCRGFKPSFYYDVDQQKCLQFNYGGCKGNGNRFGTVEECQKVCRVPIRKPKNGICNQPKKVGKCRGSIRRYYFDDESETCKIFRFGGCQPNGNNFATEEECLQTCEMIPELSTPTSADQGISRTEDSTATAVETPQPPALGEVCNLSPDAGPCRTSEKRYFFNAVVGKCMQFYYGGCRGNANNFLTLDECREGCGSKSTEEAVVTSRTRTRADSSAANPDCKLPADSGFCRANVTRFYYDDADKSCKPFTFGGCFGNGNNFMTETECLASCAPEQPRATVGPALDECAFGNLTVKAGDSVETEDPCVQCTCRTPPVVSCARQTCPSFHYVPGVVCRTIEESGRCCPTYECVPVDAPFADVCTDHVCPEGTVCKVQSNNGGPYADCVDK